MIREREGEALAPADLLEALRAWPGWDWVKSTRRLAGLLNPLGIVRQQVREGDRRRWCYLLPAEPPLISMGLVRHASDQVINSREEQLQDRRRIRLAIADHQINRGYFPQ